MSEKSENPDVQTVFQIQSVSWRYLLTCVQLISDQIAMKSQINNIMKVLELLQSFNQLQENQNTLINTKFKHQHSQIETLIADADKKIAQIKAYASYDEINERLSKQQSNMHHQSELFEQLSRQMAKLSVQQGDTTDVSIQVSRKVQDLQSLIERAFLRFDEIDLQSLEDRIPFFAKSLKSPSPIQDSSAHI